MGECIYNWPVTFVPKSNGTTAITKEFTLRQCVASIQEPELWNCNRCGSDEEYFNPIIAGDKIYLQYFVDKLSYSHILFEAVDSATDEVLASPSLEYIMGLDKNKQVYVCAVFSIDDYPDTDCLYFRAKFFTCELNEVVLEACLGGSVEDAAYEALNACYTQLCRTFDYFRTEPYRRAGCQEKTVLVEGFYSTYDCNSAFYGTFDSVVMGNVAANNYKPSIRVLGEIVKNGFAYDKTTLNTRVVGITNRQIFKFRTRKVPPYVAEVVNLCFASKNLYFDGSEYISGTQIDKNFEEGTMWIIDVNVTKECRQDNLSCDV